MHHVILIDFSDARGDRLCSVLGMHLGLGRTLAHVDAGSQDQGWLMPARRTKTEQNSFARKIKFCMNDLMTMYLSSHRETAISLPEHGRTGRVVRRRRRRGSAGRAVDRCSAEQTHLHRLFMIDSPVLVMTTQRHDSNEQISQIWQVLCPNCVYLRRRFLVDRTEHRACLMRSDVVSQLQ